jgi:hypothetical protein
VPIPEYGVILFFNLASTAKTVYLYRHTLQTGVEKKVVSAPKGVLSWEVSPNPLHSSARVSLRNGNGLRDWTAGLYSPDGRMLRELTGTRLASGVTLDASDLPAGIYVVKAVSGKVSVSKRVVIIK